MGEQEHDHNRGGMVAFVFSMVFTVSFFIYISFFHPGVSIQEIREQKKSVDNQMAKTDDGANFDPASIKAPWESSPEMIKHGYKVFMTNCSFCHGEKGLGDGAAGMALNPRPRNFVEGKWKRGGSSIDIFTTIEKGLEGTAMAKFDNIPVVDRWSIVHWIRSITKNAPPDDKNKLEAFAKGKK